jgi:hypothetical protein
VYLLLWVYRGCTLGVLIDAYVCSHLQMMRSGDAAQGSVDMVKQALRVAEEGDVAGLEAQLVPLQLAVDSLIDTNGSYIFFSTFQAEHQGVLEYLLRMKHANSGNPTDARTAAGQQAVGQQDLLASRSRARARPAAERDIPEGQEAKVRDYIEFDIT